MFFEKFSIILLLTPYEYTINTRRWYGKQDRTTAHLTIEMKWLVAKPFSSCAIYNQQFANNNFEFFAIKFRKSLIQCSSWVQIVNDMNKNPQFLVHGFWPINNWLTKNAFATKAIPTMQINSHKIEKDET